jgi:protein-S-isoprenylcysteine O-methyltransferase Ste14
MKDSSHRSWLWVAAQAALLAALLLAPSEPRLTLPKSLHLFGTALCWGGLALVVASALNLGRSLTPLPTPREEAKLKIDGLFRLVRHPIYSGVMVWAWGVALSSGGAWHGLITVLLCLFFNAKARHEEKLLRQKFPNYDAYAARTPRFIPDLRKP